MPKNKKVKTGAFKDLAIIAIVFVLVISLSLSFNIFIFILEFINKHPSAITFVDEVITGLLTLSVGFAIFSWRRWLELKRETAERIRIQEELIKLADTRVETERIISKQLHCEIEQRKKI